MFLLKCLEAAPAESMRKGTKKLAKNKKKWDLFSFLLQISKIKRSSLAIHKLNFTIENRLFKVGKTTENATFNIK